VCVCVCVCVRARARAQESLAARRYRESTTLPTWEVHASAQSGRVSAIEGQRAKQSRVEVGGGQGREGREGGRGGRGGREGGREWQGPVERGGGRRTNEEGDGRQVV
jgi:hypothetical protein